VRYSDEAEVSRVARKATLEVRPFETRREMTMEKILADLLERLAEAQDLDDVNIAAGEALNELRGLYEN
jgi:hypothetical protein